MKPNLFLKCVVLMGVPSMAMAAAIFDPNSQPIGYVARPTPSSFDVSGGAESVYLIDFDYNTGNLHKLPVSAAGVISGADSWVGGAAAQLDAQDYDTGRYIVTLKDDGTKIPFRWASLSAAQQATLGDATNGPKVLNYVRGSRADEPLNGGTFRERNTVMGDIIHSTPLYYRHATAPTVFVSANDGMVHAINASTGAERFAFIPSQLISRLVHLTPASYTTQHEYFVDGQMSLATSSSTGQTLLVGSLGGGGKGIYALDVSNPAATGEADAASKIMWEISSATSGFSNLGYTYGKPQPVKLPSGTAAVLVNNGYNNTGNGHAVLYVVNFLTGALIAEIDTGSGSAGSPNGLSTVTPVDTDGDGDTDIAYAGDIDGNLWKFDLASNTSTLLHATGQAITVAPIVHDHPSGGRMVNFATGRILTDADKTDASVFSAYGIWDGPHTNTGLLTQTLTNADYDFGGPHAAAVLIATNNTPDWGTHKGWKTDFNAGGLRVVGDTLTFSNDTFMFIASNPVLNANGDTDNIVFKLNPLTGGANSSAQFDLNEDGAISAQDHLKDSSGNPIYTTDGIPVAVDVGPELRSQPISLRTTGLDMVFTTFATEPAITSSTGSSSTSSTSTSTSTSSTSTSSGGTTDPGVSGGHFDFDIYCYTNCNTQSGASAGQTYLFTDSYKNSNTLYPNAPSYGLGAVHVHQYDDIYDVTGVDMLNASQRLMNLGRVSGMSSSSSSSTSSSSTTTQASKPAYTSGATLSNNTVTLSPGVTQTTKVVGTWTQSKKTGQYTVTLKTTVTTSTTTYTSFKILVANQAYSPAAKLSIGGGAYVPVYSYQTASGLTAASLPSYTLATVGSLKVNLPLTAFLAKDWGTGIVRAGLHPAKYSCVVSDPKPGPSGETRNGALTIQIVKDTITDADIQLNVSNGVGVTGKEYDLAAGAHPELGYRLKDSSMAANLLAQYTIFWHHPNNLCMGVSAGWIKNPPEETGTDASPATPAAGSTDPKDGVFTVSSSSSGGDGSVTSSSTSTSSSGTTVGTGTSTSTSSGGTVSTGSTLISGTTSITGLAAKLNGVTSYITADGVVYTTTGLPISAGGNRRVGWREIFR